MQACSTIRARHSINTLSLIINNNKISDLYDAALTYKTLIDSMTIRQEFKLVNNEVVKLGIPKYNNESDELLLLTTRELNNMVVTYDLFNLLDPGKVYDWFCICLRGDALVTWNGLISGKTQNKTNLKTSQVELSKHLWVNVHMGSKQNI